MAVDPDEVRDVVQDLRERGRSVIKSKDIADELGVEATGGNLTSIGFHLNALADEGGVEVASRGGAANTYRILDSEPEIAADGGQSRGVGGGD